MPMGPDNLANFSHLSTTFANCVMTYIVDIPNNFFPNSSFPFKSLFGHVLREMFEADNVVITKQLQQQHCDR